METYRQLRRLRRHLIIHAEMLFSLMARSDRPQAAINATLRRIEATIAEMDTIEAVTAQPKGA